MGFLAVYAFVMCLGFGVEGLKVWLFKVQDLRLQGFRLLGIRAS